MKSVILVGLTLWLACQEASATEAPAAAPHSTASPASPGKMLVDASGTRLGVVYRLAANGSPQIILEGRIVTVPLETVSQSGDKVATSLTKSQVVALR